MGYGPGMGLVAGTADGRPKKKVKPKKPTPSVGAGLQAGRHPKKSAAKARAKAARQEERNYQRLKRQGYYDSLTQTAEPAHPYSAPIQLGDYENYKAFAELREKMGGPSPVQRGVLAELGIIDDEQAAEARKALFGTKNLGAGDVAMAVGPLGPVGRAIRGAKAIKAATSVERAATASKAAKAPIKGLAKTATKKVPKSAPKPKVKVKSKLKAPSKRTVKKGGQEAVDASAARTAAGKSTRLARKQKLRPGSVKGRARRKMATEARRKRAGVPRKGAPVEGAKLAAKNAPRRVARYSQRRPVKAALLVGTGAAAAKEHERTGAFVEGYATAIKEDPVGIAKQTGEMLPQVIGSLIGDTANVGLTGGRLLQNALPGENPYTTKEALAPAKGVLDANVQGTKQLFGEAFSGDPERVQALAEDTGLAVPITLGLAAKPIVPRGGLTKVRRVAEKARGKITDKAVVADTKAIRQETVSKGEKAAKKLRDTGHGRRRPEKPGKPQPLFAATERRQQRKREGEAQAVTSELQQGHLRDADLGKKMRRVKQEHRNFVALVAETGLPLNDPARSLGALRDVLKSLPQDSPNAHLTRRLIEDFDEVAESRHFSEAVTRYREVDKELRATTRKGKDDRRSLGQRTAITYGITMPEDAVPMGARPFTSAATREQAWAEVEAAPRTERSKKLRAALEPYTRPGQDPNNSKRKAYDEELLDEFDRAVKTKQAEKGLEEPAWISHRPADKTQEATGVDAYGAAAGYRGAGIPARDKMRMNRAAAGNVDFSYAALATESVLRRVQKHVTRRHVQDFLRRNRIKVRLGDEPARSIIDGAEANVLAEKGVVDPRHNAVFALQEWRRTFEGSEDFDEGLAAERESVLAEIKIGEAQPGKKYVVVPRESLKELEAQLGKQEGTFDGMTRKLRATQRATSRALLGTSPAWAVAQIVAETAQASLAVNPARIIKGLREFRKLSPEDQRSFRAWMEAAPGGGVMPEIQTSLTRDATKEAGAALGAYGRTRAGHWLRQLASAEPLIALDRWKANYLRTGVAAGKIDRDLNSFLTKLGRLNNEIPSHIQKMERLPLHEQLAYFAKHPKDAERVAGYVRDVMGSWSSMTRFERSMGPALMFYPFLRFSLRWTFRTFPSQHPIKAAILLNLATVRTEEVKQLLGGDPSFFATLSQQPLRTGPGGSADPDDFFSTARAVPAGNVLVEAGINEQTQDLGALTRSIQPFLAAPLLAALSHDPRTGRPLSDAEREGVMKGLVPMMQAAGSALLSTPTAFRMADALVHGADNPKGTHSVPVFGGREDSEISLLFAAMKGEDAGLRSFVNPFQPQSLESQRDSTVRAEELIGTAFDAPSKGDVMSEPDPALQREMYREYQDARKAWEELDDLMVKYGVKTRADIRREDRQFGRSSDRYYRMSSRGGSEEDGFTGALDWSAVPSSGPVLDWSKPPSGSTAVLDWGR